MSDVIATDANNSSVDSGLIELVEVSIQGVTYYFSPEAGVGEDIIFDGNTYVPFPIQVTGVEVSSDGAQNRPKLAMANIISLTTSDSLGPDFDFDDLIGGRVTVRTTLNKYLGVGATPQEFPKKVFVIDRISAKNQLMIELELSSPFDLQNVKIPSRIVVGKYCPWVYKQHVLGSNDSKSACYWKTNFLKDANGNKYFLFFTKDDEPLIHETQLSAVNSYYKGPYSASSSYEMGEIVFSSGYYWQSKDYGNSGNTPGEDNALFWQKVRKYSTWNSSTTYLSADIPEDNDYVYYNDKVYRCIQNNVSVAPGTNKLFWREADQCGKLVSSCKARYQATLHSTSGAGINTRPHYFKNRDITLPFGGFPGSRKFR